MPRASKPRPPAFRYTVAAPKGKTTTAALTLERIENASVVLTTLAAEDILARVRGLQNESEAFKTTVARLSSIVNDINKAKAQRNQLDGRAQEDHRGSGPDPGKPEGRSGRGNDLGKRYIDSLKSQEDRLAQIAQQDRGQPRPTLQPSAKTPRMWPGRSISEAQPGRRRKRWQRRIGWAVYHSVSNPDAWAAL